METRSILAQTVRKADYDRYLSVLFAPAASRAHLFALYAFNYEIARIAEIVSEPMLGLVRLQWWRDAVGEIYSGRPRRHDALEGLAAAVAAADLPHALIAGLIEAREADLSPAPFANMAQLEAYADATSGHLMALAARILGAGDTLDAPAREFGIAYALTGLLRALPFHAARRRLMLPRDALAAAGIGQDDLFAGRAGKIRTLMDAIARTAGAHLAAARKAAIRRAHLSAFLPAALVAPYLRLMSRPGFAAFRDSAELSVPRRQFAMLAATLRGRI